MSHLEKLKSRVLEKNFEMKELSSRSRSSLILGKKEPPPSHTPTPLLTVHQSKLKKPIQNTSELEQTIQDLQQELENQKKINFELSCKALEIQEKQVKREQEYRLTVTDFDSKVAGGLSPRSSRLFDSTRQKIDDIQKYHHKIIRNLSTVQNKTLSLLRGQEIEVIKDLNEKLGQLCQELENERKSVLDFGTRKGKETELKSELEKLRLKIDDIDNKNKKYTAKNYDLKIIQKSHDQDSLILQKQFKALKEQNEILKNKLIIRKTGRFTPQPFREISPVKAHSKLEESNHYQEVINKIKKMIELESKSLRAAKTAYSRELESRKELEKFLRDCVDDVKMNVAQKRTEQKLQASDKSFDDIEKIIEILVSQERVLTLLYDKAFPHRLQNSSSRPNISQKSIKMNVGHSGLLSSTNI